MFLKHTEFCQSEKGSVAITKPVGFIYGQNIQCSSLSLGEVFCPKEQVWGFEISPQSFGEA